MATVLRFFLVLMLATHLGSCVSSLKRSLSEVREGMSKAEVLEIAGNPKYSHRTQGLDEWQYKFYHDDQMQQINVYFKDGRVVKKESPSKDSHQLDRLKESSTLEEYESNVRKLKKNDDSGFRSIDSESSQDQEQPKPEN